MVVEAGERVGDRVDLGAAEADRRRLQHRGEGLAPVAAQRLALRGREGRQVGDRDGDDIARRVSDRRQSGDPHAELVGEHGVDLRPLAGEHLRSARRRRRSRRRGATSRSRSSSGSTPMTKRLSTCACVVRNRVGGLASRTSRSTCSISRYALEFSSSRASSAAWVSPRMRAAAFAAISSAAARRRATSSSTCRNASTISGSNWRAAAALQLRQALRVGERGLVGAPARHGVVGVHDGHGASQRRDRLAGEAVRVAVAVVALVVVAHGEHEVRGEERADDVGAHHGVLAHLVPLLLVQAARLEEHPVGDADLADVVQVRGLLQRREDVLLPAQLVCPASPCRPRRARRGPACSSPWRSAPSSAP